MRVATRPPCDVCAQDGRATPAHFDARTRWGPWAYLCVACFVEVGPGRLGTGFGQALLVEGEATPGV